MKLLQKKQQKPARRTQSGAAQGGRATTAELEERYAFRRNRTLTGSLSSSVSSANEYRAELKSFRVQSHDLHKHRRRLRWMLLLVSVIVVALAWIIYQSVAVPKVSIVGLSRDPDLIYSKKIQEYLNGHLFERSRMTLDTKNLAEYLQQHDCPEVASVSSDMRFVGIGVSEISLTTRRPVVSWKTQADQLYVDDEGVSFTRNYHEQPTVEVIDESGVPTVNNRALVFNRFLTFVGKSIGRFKSQGLTVANVALPVGVSHQVHVTLAEVSYPIKLSVDRSAGEQAEDAARAVRHLQAQGVSPVYLDVRVSGRAYYR